MATRSRVEMALSVRRLELAAPGVELALVEVGLDARQEDARQQPARALDIAVVGVKMAKQGKLVERLTAFRSRRGCRWRGG